MTAKLDVGEQLVPEIYVRDLEASAAFYRNIGFAEMRRTEKFAVMRFEDSLLFLAKRDGLGPVPSRPQASVRVVVSNVDERWEKTLAIGLTVFEPIADREYGLRDFTFLDPDGVGLRFASFLK